MAIPSKSEDELKRLAGDIFENKVFTSDHIPSGDAQLIRSVFLPLAFGAFSKMTKEEIEDIGMVYEYRDRAGPGFVAGCPTFCSFRVLNKSDGGKVRKCYGEIKDAVEKVLHAEGKGEKG